MKWLYDRYLLTPIIGGYYMILVGFGTYQLFISPVDINDSASTAYGFLMGLPAVAIGLIKWRLDKVKGGNDDRAED